MDKNTDNIKKDNKKAIPKYAIIILACGLAGFIFGWFSYSLEQSDWRSVITNGLLNFLQIITPYISIACLVLFVLPSFVLYRKALKLADSWDGENEDIPEIIDKNLNIALLLDSITMLVSMFGLSCILMVNCGLGGSLIAFFSFIVVQVLITLIQQKSVDLTRRMNPEKQGSVYDPKFQKKWYGSCDEAEKQQIGEAAYYSFGVTTKSCMILWSITFLTHIIFNTGLFPMFLVLLITGISQISYIIKAMELGKSK